MGGGKGEWRGQGCGREGQGGMEKGESRGAGEEGLRQRVVREGGREKGGQELPAAWGA